MSKEILPSTATPINAPFDIPDFVSWINEEYEKRATSWPAKSLHASSIGFPCARNLVYEQVAWEAKKKPDAWLMLRFQIGNALEKLTIRDLEDVAVPRGFRVEETNVPIPDNPYNIGGKIDAKIFTPQRQMIPIEIKSINQFGFDGIETIVDMLDHSSVYIRKYPAQLMTYLYFTNTEWGLFFLKELSGAYKQIPMHLDLEYMEGLLKKAEIVSASVAKYRGASTAEAKEAALPARVRFEGAVCGKCPFLSICCPDMAGRAGVENLLWDVQLDALCRIREDTAKAKKEYEAADEKIKAHAVASCQDLKHKGETRTLVTEHYNITVKVSERKTFSVPDDVKAKYQSTSVSYRTDIQKVDAT